MLVGKLNITKYFVSMMSGLLLTSPAFAANSGITYHGRILNPDTTPVTDSAVQFKMQIRTPDGQSCLMYEEVQVKDLSTSMGAFSITINDGTGTRTDSSGYVLDRVFANTGSLTFAPATCSAGTGNWTPNSADGRSFQVQFKTSSMGTWEPLPPQSINYIPMAIEAKQVAGFPGASLFRVENGSGPQTVSSITPAQATALINLSNGTSTAYVQSNSNGATLPSFAANPASPTSGQVWYDSTNKLVKYYDGTSIQTVGASLPNVGTAGTYTKVTTDTQGRVTAGAQITGSDITSGTIGGSTAMNTTGTVTAASVSSTTDSTQALRIFEGTNTHKVTVTVPSSLAADYPLQLPGALPASNGMALVSTTAGVMSWSAVGTGDFMKDGSVAMTAPLKITPTALPGSPSAGTLTFDSGASNALKFYDGSSWQTVGTGGSSQWNNGASSSINYLAGNVGVGTNTPRANLHIAPNSGGNPANTGWELLLQNDPNIATGSNLGMISGNSGTSTINFGTRTDLTVGSIGFQNANNAMTFSTWNGTAATERMRITGANVGIGTTSPTRLLDVNGPIHIAPAALPSSPTAGELAFDSGASNALKFYNGSSWQTVGTGTGGGDFMKDGSVAMTGNFNAGGNSVLGNTTASANLKLESTSNATKGNVLIQPNGGNVGIGTTSPVGYGSGGPILGIRGTASTVPEISLDATPIGGSNWVTVSDNNGNFYFRNVTTSNTPMTIHSNSYVDIDKIAVGSYAGTAPPSGGIIAPGNVGIGTTAPTRLLDVNGPIHITPAALPSSPTAGELAFDSGASNALKFYNGSSWQTVGTGAGSGDFMKDGSVAMTGNFNAGGNKVLGNTTASANLELESTSNATKGYVLLQKNGGRVGIGTATPSAPLSIVASQSGVGDDMVVIQNTNNSGFSSINFKDDAGTLQAGIGYANSGTAFPSTFMVGSITAVPMTFGTAGVEAMRITTAGSVGIGTNAPTRLLDVNGPIHIKPAALPSSPTAGELAFDSGASNALKFYNGSAWQTVGTGAGSGDFMKDGSVAMTGNFNAGGNSVLGNTTASANLKLESTSNATKGYVLLQPNGGNVGIGTTAPSTLLHLRKDQNSNTTVTAENRSAGGSASTEFYATNNSAGVSLGIMGPSASFSFLGNNEAYMKTDGKLSLWANAGAPGFIRFLSGSSEMARFDNGTGYMGIGTDTPTRLLDVNGPIHIKPAALPSSPTAGELAFDSGASNALKFYNGSSWQTVGTGAGSGDFMKDGSVAMTGNFNAGGNSVLGNTTASANLTLESTSNITKGYVAIQPTSGNVSIGTTSPSEKLSVYASGANGGGMSVATIGTGTAQQAYVNLVSKTSAGSNSLGVATTKGWQIYTNSDAYTAGGGFANTFGIGFVSGTSWNDPSIQLGANYKNGVRLQPNQAPVSTWDVNGNMAIGSYAATNAPPTNGMIVSGNVGIGTSSPNQLLTVEGPMSLRSQAAPTATANYGKIYVDSGDSNKLKYMNPAGTVTDLTAGGGGGSSSRNAVTYSATPTVNWATSNIQSIVLTGNATLTFSGGTDGAKYTLMIVQDATGSRTITWPGNVRFPGGSPVTLTTTGNKTDYIGFIYNGISSTYDAISFSQNY